MVVEMVPYRYRVEGREGLYLPAFMPVYEATEVIAHAKVKDMRDTTIEGFPIRADGRFFHKSLLAKVARLFTDDPSSRTVEEGENTDQTECESQTETDEEEK